MFIGSGFTATGLCLLVGACSGLHRDPAPDAASASICGDGIVQQGERCDDGDSVAWDGCTDCRYTEVQVAGPSPLGYGGVAVAAAGTDRFVVVYLVPDGSPASGSVAARFMGPGVELGRELEVAKGGTDWVGGPRVAGFADGSFIVGWKTYTEPERYEIWGRRFQADGQPANDATVLGTYDNQYHWANAMSLASAADGRFVLVWSTSGSGDLFGAVARLFDVNGEPRGERFQVNDQPDGYQTGVEAAMAPDGRFAVLWAQDDGSPDGIWELRARTFDEAGVPISGDIEIENYQDNSVYGKGIGMLESGDFLVTWGVPDAFGPEHIFLQRYTLEGERVNDAAILPALDPGAERVMDYRLSCHPDGTTVLTWSESGMPVTMRFDTSGNPVDAPTPVTEFAVVQGYQGVNGLAIGSDHSWAVLFHRETVWGDPQELFVKRFPMDTP